MSYANSEIHPTARQWFRPLLGIDPYSQSAVQKSIENTKLVLKVLEDSLSDKTYLVGEQVSLADLFVAGILARQFDLILDEQFRRGIPQITRWFEEVANQPMFKAVNGEPKLCKEGLANKPLTLSA